jgi:dinuclear metal center YbgI/SA1388 family protein
VSDAGAPICCSIDQLTAELERLAPLHRAEPWDNVGWLVDRRDHSIRRVMTCLTIAPAVVAEAIDRQCDVIVAHHPLPFQPLRRLVRTDLAGRLLLDLITHGVGVYSPHTAFDSATEGINAQLAARLGLRAIRPIVPMDQQPGSDRPSPGSGRYGTLPQPITLEGLAEQLSRLPSVTALQIAGPPKLRVSTLGIACGAGHSFWPAAQAAGCDALITGEARFHDAVAAEGQGYGLLALGHFASERFALEQLAFQLQQALPGLHVWASERETDPWRTLC